MEYYGFIVSLLNKPLLFVFGNHNLKRFRFYQKGPATAEESWLERIKFNHNFGATYVGDKIEKNSGLLIGGLGGSMRYNNGENQYTEGQMFFKALKLLPRMLWNKLVHGRYLDILLTHASPRGIHDKPDKCHTGFKVFLWFMRWFKPKYLIHGHIHLYDINAQTSRPSITTPWW
jgi:Icc-related predicted phosphoesterase